MSRRSPDLAEIERLAKLLSSAKTAVYVRMFTDPRSGYTDHDAGGRLFRACPEVKPQAEAYYVAVARELAAAGVRVVAGEPAAADEVTASRTEATVAKVETEPAPVVPAQASAPPAPAAKEPEPAAKPTRKPKRSTATGGMFS